MTSNPLRILQTLDRHLATRFSMYIYGRSALALGYPDAPATFHSTVDIDAILPGKDLQGLEQNDDFWNAQQRTNEELDGSGLYFTHLFEDRQVILTSDWLERVVAIDGLGFEKLRLFRPSTIDLILTKMMRVDPDDREDIKFLMHQKDCDISRLSAAFDIAVVPAVPEIEEAFVENRKWIAGTLA